MESSGSVLFPSTIHCISLTAAILSLNWKRRQWALYQFRIFSTLLQNIAQIDLRHSAPVRGSQVLCCDLNAWHIVCFAINDVCNQNRFISLRNRERIWSCVALEHPNSCEHSLNSEQPVNNVNVCVCVQVYMHMNVHVCAYACVCIWTESRSMKQGLRAGGGLPWSLSISRSGVPLLAIISPVRSRAGPPPRHISLCQFTCCLWIEPRSMKLRVTVIITFGDTCCFSPRLHHKMSPLILGLRLICLIRVFTYIDGYFIPIFKPCLNFCNWCVWYFTLYNCSPPTHPLHTVKSHCSSTYSTVPS